MSSKDPKYKRAMDIFILIFAHTLPVLVPVWALLLTLIPLAVWLEDRGPIFYRQKRAGKDGKVFTVLKFRSMVPNADQQGPAWTTPSDPRVTRVGRLLRKTALDELPELLSIWKGDMSFVGPRALDVEEQRWLEEQIPNFSSRLAVRPGLTGLAQIYDLTDEARTKLEYDLEYIQRMNAWLDLKLMLLSIRNTLLGSWDQRTGKALTEEEDRPGGVSQNRNTGGSNFGRR